MNELLNVASTRRNQKDDPVPLIIQEAPNQRTEQVQVSKVEPGDPNLETPDDVLQALKSEPSLNTLKSCLVFLSIKKGDFNIKVPSPQSTQIIYALVNDVLPAYWSFLANSESTGVRYQKLFLDCLTSVAGLGALIVRLRTLLTASHEDGPSKVGKKERIAVVRDVVEVFHRTLRGKKTLHKLLESIDEGISKPVQRHVLKKELVGLLSSGKILALCAEALIYCELPRAESHEVDWLGEGRIYASWLGENIHQAFVHAKLDGSDQSRMDSTVLSKGLLLGYGGRLI